MSLPVVLVACAVLVCAGCAGSPASDDAGGMGQPTGAPPTGSASVRPEGASPSAATDLGPASPSRRPPASTPAEPSPPAPRFDARAAREVVERLARSIGPREATSSGFAEAADLVARRLAGYGYRVERDGFRVPGGVSWGVRVAGGPTQNVVAKPAGFDPRRPYRLVGAHLDTVPQAPGAEDNASGIAVLLELARMTAAAPPEVPAVFVAFGAEEPRGPGDDQHHFGSRHLVADLPAGRRRAVVGMISLDRVGVRARAVPVCSGGRGSTAVREELVAAARTVRVTVRRCENRTSDHWPFEKAGVAAARLGGVPYAGYHSRHDVFSVVDPAQLDRVGRIAWAWLNRPA